jgi:hypothetical protein
VQSLTPPALSLARVPHSRIRELGELAEKAAREAPKIGLYAAAADAAEIAAYEGAGVSRYVFYVSPKSRDEVSERLDKLTGVIDEYRRAGG